LTSVTVIHNIVYRWLFGLGTLNIQIAIIQQAAPGETAAQITAAVLRQLGIGETNHVRKT
jgi:hypothetical protein